MPNITTNHAITYTNSKEKLKFLKLYEDQGKKPKYEATNQKKVL